MRDPLSSATLKEELYDRIADFLEDQDHTMDEEVLMALVSEIYSFLTEVQEEETMTLPTETEDEEEQEGSGGASGTLRWPEASGWNPASASGSR